MMTLTPDVSIRTHFAAVDDPRIERTKRHQLLDVLTIALCAVICGADTWVDVEAFGHAKEAWFATFLALEQGIPSHDTFGRVFARLDPEQCGQCFLSLGAGSAGRAAAAGRRAGGARLRWQDAAPLP